MFAVLFGILADFAMDFKFLLGIGCNFLALYLIIKQSKKGLYDYRKLLVIFLLSDTLFTVLHAALKPVGVVEGNLLLLYLSGPIKHRYWLAVYTSCVSGSFLILAFHFLYRVLAVTSKHVINVFLTPTILSVLILFIAVEYAAWAYMTLSFSYQEIYGDAARSHFNAANTSFPENPLNEFVIYLGRVDGELNMPALASALALTAIMAATAAVIMISCVIILRIVLTIQNVSPHWRQSQIQLFVALLVQLFIPLVTLYIPVGIYVLTPFIPNNPLHTPPWVLTTLYSWFPIADPISIILLIGDYRNALINMLPSIISKKASTMTTVTRITVTQSAVTQQ